MSIQIPIITDFDGKGIRKAIEQFKQLETNAQKLDFAVKSIGTAIVGGAAAQQLAQFGQEAVKAALEDARGQALLADQLKKTAGASQEAIRQNEGFIDGLMKATNVADDQLRPALATLVRGTKDVATAQTALKSAVDISVATGRDLESVSMAISKAATGQVTALQRLGVPLSENAKKSKDFTVVMRELDTVFGGAAATAADTLSGKLQNLSIRWQEQKERIGYELLPVVTKAADELDRYMKIAEDTHPVVALANAFYDLANAVTKPTGLIKGLVVGTWNNLTGATDRKKKADEAAKQAAQELSDKYRQMSTVLQGIKTDTDAATDSQTKFQAQIDKFRFDQQVDSMKKMLDALKQVDENKKTAASAFADLGKTIRTDLANKVDELRASLKALAAEYSSQITGIVNLGTAWDKATASDKAAKDALTERTKAYEELAKLNPAADADKYAEALQNVYKAERDVRDTQSAKVDYTKVFADQIAAAKEFAGNLKTLMGDPYNLGKAGISQLLNAGPVAGNEIAKSLLSGVSMSPGQLKADLAEIGSIAGSFGATAANLFGIPGSNNANSVVDALGSAKVQPGGRTYQIIVNAGIADKKEVARQVVDALKDYEKTYGSVPVKTR